MGARGYMVAKPETRPTTRPRPAPPTRRPLPRNPTWRPSTRPTSPPPGYNPGPRPTRPFGNRIPRPKLPTLPGVVVGEIAKAAFNGSPYAKAILAAYGLMNVLNRIPETPRPYEDEWLFSPGGYKLIATNANPALVSGQYDWTGKTDNAFHSGLTAFGFPGYWRDGIANAGPSFEGAHARNLLNNPNPYTIIVGRHQQHRTNPAPDFQRYTGIQRWEAPRAAFVPGTNPGLKPDYVVAPRPEAMPGLNPPVYLIPIVNRLPHRSVSNGPKRNNNPLALRNPGRPPRGTKERKVKSNIGKLAGALSNIFHTLTEAGDFVGSIFDATGTAAQRKDVKGLHNKMAFIVANFDDIDWKQAIINLINNEVEDRVIGKIMGALDKQGIAVGPSGMPNIKPTGMSW